MRETQDAAIALYESLGYIRWGIHPAYARVGGRTIRGFFYYKLLAAARTDRLMPGSADAVPGHRPQGRRLRAAAARRHGGGHGLRDRPGGAGAGRGRRPAAAGCIWSTSTAPSPAARSTSRRSRRSWPRPRCRCSSAAASATAAAIERWLDARRAPRHPRQRRRARPGPGTRRLPRHPGRSRSASTPATAWSRSRAGPRTSSLRRARPGAAVRGCRRGRDHLHRYRPRRNAGRPGAGGDVRPRAASCHAGDRLGRGRRPDDADSRSAAAGRRQGSRGCRRRDRRPRAVRWANRGRVAQSVLPDADVDRPDVGPAGCEHDRTLTPLGKSQRCGVLKLRVIPCLDVKDGRVVKGVNFVSLRDAGDPVEQAAVYDAAGADELAFLDITASHENRDTMLDVVARTAARVFLPLTVGGGVRSIADMRRAAAGRRGQMQHQLGGGGAARPGGRGGPQIRQPVRGDRGGRQAGGRRHGTCSPMAAGATPASTRWPGAARWPGSARAKSC